MSDAERLSRLILSKIALLGWDKHILCERAGINYRTLNSKLASGNFTFPELCRISKAMRLDEQEIGIAITGGKK